MRQRGQGVKLGYDCASSYHSASHNQSVPEERGETMYAKCTCP